MRRKPPVYNFAKANTSKSRGVRCADLRTSPVPAWFTSLVRTADPTPRDALPPGPPRRGLGHPLVSKALARPTGPR